MPWKKGDCQDGKNMSAPFYLFPQHWDCGRGLSCIKKGCVCLREWEIGNRDKRSLWKGICWRQRIVGQSITCCVDAHVCKLNLVWSILKQPACEENNYCNASGSNQYKRPAQRGISGIKPHDMSFLTFIFTIPNLIFFPSYLCWFLSSFEAMQAREFRGSCWRIFKHI